MRAKILPAMVTRALFLALAACAWANGADAQQRNDAPPDTLYDVQHPAGFVGLYEQTDYRHEYALYEGWSSSGPAHSWGNSPVGEVDRGSRLLVRFNRGLILQNHKRMNGQISIRGFLTKADGSKPAIEIAGYSQIGQQSRVASVSIRNGIDLLKAFEEIWRLSDSLSRQLQDTLTHLVANSLVGTRTQNDSLDSLNRRSQQLRARMDTMNLSLHDVRARFLVLQDSLVRAQASGDSAAVKQVRTTYQLLGTAYQRAIEAYNDSTSVRFGLDTLSAALRNRVSKGLLGPQLRILQTTKGLVVEAGGTIGILVKKLVSTADTVPLNVLARRVGRDADVLRKDAQTVLDGLDSIRTIVVPTDTSDVTIAMARDSLNAAITRTRNALGDLGSVAQVILSPKNVFLEDSLAKDFTYYLKDAYLLVDETGAQPGDAITIIVSSVAQDGDLPRELELKVRVQQFGLVSHISDSFLFLNREGIPRPSAPPAGSADTLAARYNYLPTPGITFGWTLYYRRQWPGASLMRWLQPGFGINVSFPRFGTTVIQTPSGGGAPVTTTSTPDGFDLAVGGVITLFDGALQLTWGRDLTASTAHAYWGIGFSFIRTVGAIQQLAKGGQ
jgi:hypothetical protein